MAFTFCSVIQYKTKGAHTQTFKTKKQVFFCNPDSTALPKVRRHFRQKQRLIFFSIEILSKKMLAERSFYNPTFAVKLAFLALSTRGAQ